MTDPRGRKPASNGDARSYTDNGNGTITDNKTGLMWEKKIKLDNVADATNLHDADNQYPWAGTCLSETGCYSGGTCCQSNADCVAPHTCYIDDPQGTNLTIFAWVAQLNAANFAGYNDWRIPNVNELQSIANYGVYHPSVSAAFQGASCGASCTNITSAACSCTSSNNGYWSSTTVATIPYDAWTALYSYGYLMYGCKDTYGAVRAVRGGL